MRVLAFLFLCSPQKKMGVDGLCTDYPERVHESNRRLRPQASQTDAATFPFPQGPASSGVDLRGLAEEMEAKEEPACAKGSAGDAGDEDDDDNSTASFSSNSTSIGGGGGSSRISRRSRPSRCISSSSSSAGSHTTSKAEDTTDSNALGGWYSRGDSCEQAEGSDQQRLIAALYGDLAGVRDFAVWTIEDAKVLVKVCSHAAAVRSFLAGDAMKGKRATAELAAATSLCKEAEAEAEHTLRPYVSSAETFKWSVNLISTAKVITTCASHERWNGVRAYTRMRLSVRACCARCLPDGPDPCAFFARSSGPRKYFANFKLLLPRQRTTLR